MPGDCWPSPGGSLEVEGKKQPPGKSPSPRHSPGKNGDSEKKERYSVTGLSEMSQSLPLKTEI